MGLNYCQDTVLDAYHSNETILSGMAGRSWRDFVSLVRRKKGIQKVTLGAMKDLNYRERRRRQKGWLA
jgi:hypothetical protein